MIELAPKFAGQAPVGPAPSGETQTSAASIADWTGAKGLAEDVRRYGLWMRDEAERRIGRLYPAVTITKEMVKERPDLRPYEGQKLTVVAWIWARTVASPSPAFAETAVPLASTFMLSRVKGRETYVDPIIDGGSYKFVVRYGTPSNARADDGTSAGKWNAFKCLMSDVPITYDYIRAEGVAGRVGARLMALVVEGPNTRLYVSPTPDMEAIASSAQPSWGPDLQINHHPRDIKTPIYGLTKYRDLFTPRQLVALTTFADLVSEARERVLRDAISAGTDDADGLASAYADTVAIFLSFLLSKLADKNSSICTWDAGPTSTKTDTGRSARVATVRVTFGRQALPMTWDFAEANPFSDSVGSIGTVLKTIASAIERLPATMPRGRSEQLSATDLPATSRQVFSTDPPYYDNIGYADLSDYFYVWLRRSLVKIVPSLFSTLAVPKAEELVASPYRHDGAENAERFFLNGMSQAMARMSEATHPAMPVTIYYAFKQAETGDSGTSSTGWETFLAAVVQAGFSIVGTWPMRTELGSRMIGRSNALASSIVLVCRRRGREARSIARKEFLRELAGTLPAAIAEMTADPIAAIAPVDLAQACIGPGMAIFSKYAAVLEADGTSMSVHNALVHVNKAVDEYFAHAEGDLDADSRFCIGWFEQRGFEDGPFGEADVLARAKGTSVDGVKEAGVIEAGKGKVRLLKIKELPKNWDPTKDARVPTWEALHHMCRALGESEGDAGSLLAKMQARQDAIRQLAYRLYTLCERKGWAEHARAYNELITSWPEIVKASQQTAPRGQIELV